MNAKMRSVWKRLAELHALKRPLSNHEKNEEKNLQQVNIDFWRDMAELENMAAVFYMIDDLAEVQKVCYAIDELEATGKHTYFQEQS